MKISIFYPSPHPFFICPLKEERTENGHETEESDEDENADEEEEEEEEEEETWTNEQAAESLLALYEAACVVAIQSLRPPQR